MKNNYKIFMVVISGAIISILQNCSIISDENINVVCNSNCTIIEGQFTTDGGQSPIENVSIEFDWSIYARPLASRTRKIATTKTDENGNYKIKFYAEEEELTEGNYSIQFKVPDSSYIVRESYSYFKLFGIQKRDTIVTRDYHIPQKGGKIHIKIINPQDILDDDQLICTVSYKYDDLTKNIQAVAGQLFSNIKSEENFETAINQFTYIKVSKKVNSEYYNSLDSVIVSLNETKAYEIEF